MLMSCLTLKLYFKLLVYDRNIFSSSLEVFGDLRTFSENVCMALGHFWESSEIFGKWSEIFGKSTSNDCDA